MRMKSEKQIVIARNSVRSNGAPAIFEVIAAEIEVGGVTSPQTPRKKAKKCTTRGLTPTLIIGGAITSAVMM